jgi:hypothetical protein
MTKRIGKWTMNLLRFQVLTAASMKMAVFWDVVSRSLVKEDPTFPR